MTQDPAIVLQGTNVGIDPAAVLMRGPHANAQMDAALGLLTESRLRQFAIECAEEVLFAYTAPGGGDTLIKALDLAKQAVADPLGIRLGPLQALCDQIARSHPNPTQGVAKAVACALSHGAPLLLAHKHAQGAWFAANVMVDFSIKDSDARKKDHRRREQAESDRFCANQLERLAGHVRIAYQEAVTLAEDSGHPPLLHNNGALVVSATLIREQVREQIAFAASFDLDEKLLGIVNQFQADLSEQYAVHYWTLDRVRSAKGVCDQARLLRRTAPTPSTAVMTLTEANP